MRKEKEQLSIQIEDRIWLALVVYQVEDVEGGQCERCGDKEDFYYVRPLNLRVQAARDQFWQEANRQEKIRIQRKLAEALRKRFCRECLTRVRQVHYSNAVVPI